MKIPANTTATLYLPVSKEIADTFETIPGVLVGGVDVHNGQDVLKLALVSGENELADVGVLPDAPRPGDGVMNLSAEGFPGIALKAKEGDGRAVELMAKMNAANEMG